MRKPALLALSMLVPALVQAAPPAQPTSTVVPGVRMGLGVAVHADDPAVYLPIDVSPTFRVEPYFAWSETDTTVGGASTSSETRTVGAGGFFRLGMHERLQAYFGARLGYMEAESPGSDLDGFSLEPTLGAEFAVTDRVSVALEAFFYRRDLDGAVGGAPAEQESSGSDTRLLVRFFP
jgi:opacity protein-like surface antigen